MILTRFLPDENAVIMRNGRRIEYSVMVNAMGLQKDLDQIKGFEEAWADSEHPVYSS